MTTTEYEPRSTYQHGAWLFEQFATCQPAERRRIRDLLVEEYLPVAEHIARKFRNRGQPPEDLAQVATIGLIKAVDRFDPAKGAEFLCFAIPSITGELRRYFRDSTWSVHVPRQLKELDATIRAASLRLSVELGRPPRASELAAELELTIEDVYEGLQVNFAYRCDSLDVAIQSSHQHAIPHQLTETDRQLALAEDRTNLFRALTVLPEREVSILLLRYFGDLTQSQIGERIGLSQMQVSRLLAAGLRTLREQLADTLDAGHPLAN